MYTPHPGDDWNPLRRHRNLPCPCGSGKKIKRCHGQAETLPLDDLPKVKEYLKRLAMHGFIKERQSEVS